MSSCFLENLFRQILGITFCICIVPVLTFSLKVLPEYKAKLFWSTPDKTKPIEARPEEKSVEARPQKLVEAKETKSQEKQREREGREREKAKKWEKLYTLIWVCWKNWSSFWNVICDGHGSGKWDEILNGIRSWNEICNVRSNWNDMCEGSSNWS